MIIDEFTDMQVSRQRKYQMRNYRDGKCMWCSRIAVTAVHCEEHRRKMNVTRRENQRRAKGATRRNLNAESYEFQM